MDNSSMSRREQFNDQSTQDNNNINVSLPSQLHVPHSSSIPHLSQHQPNINQNPTTTSTPLNQYRQMPSTSLATSLPKLSQKFSQDYPSYSHVDTDRYNPRYTGSSSIPHYPTANSGYLHSTSDAETKIQSQQINNNNPLAFNTSHPTNSDQNIRLQTSTKHHWSSANITNTIPQSSLTLLPPQPIEMGSFPTSRSNQSIPQSSPLVLQHTNQQQFLDSTNIHGTTTTSTPLTSQPTRMYNNNRLSLPSQQHSNIPISRTLPVPVVGNQNTSNYCTIPDRLSNQHQRVINDTHLSPERIPLTSQQPSKAMSSHHNPNSNMYDIGKLLAAKCVVVSGKVYNDKGHNICGVLNQHDKPCKRIGRCPFHGDTQLVTKDNVVNGVLDSRGSAGVSHSSDAMTRYRQDSSLGGTNAMENESPAAINCDIVAEPPKKQQYKHGWTKEEHYLFLLGLKMHDRGLWKPISDIVKTRTPTQVQSHAQKYFLRQKQKDKNKRSIHDLTLDSPEMQEIGRRLRLGGMTGHIPSFALGDSLHAAASGMNEQRLQRDIRGGFSGLDMGSIHNGNQGLNNSLGQRSVLTGEAGGYMRLGGNHNSFGQMRFGHTQNTSPTTIGSSLSSHANVQHVPNNSAPSQTQFPQSMSPVPIQNDILNPIGTAPMSNIMRPYGTPGSSQAHAEMMSRNGGSGQNGSGMIQDVFVENRTNALGIGHPVFSRKPEGLQRTSDHGFVSNFGQSKIEPGYDHGNRTNMYQIPNMSSSYRTSDGHQVTRMHPINAIDRPHRHGQNTNGEGGNIGWQYDGRGTRGQNNGTKESGSLNGIQSMGNLPTNLNESFPSGTGLPSNVGPIDTNQLFFEHDQN